jgi:HTH-type transcriptional regulator/antitoxin HipB
MPSPSLHPLVTAPQLGQLLILNRRRLRLTQSDVAIRLGLSQNRVSHLEHHADEISVRQLMSWCAALGLQLRLGERDTAEDNSIEW